MRTTRTGGGVSITYSKKKFIVSEIKTTSCDFDHLEVVFVTIQQGEKSIAVVSCYRPPYEANFYNFIASFCEKLSSAGSRVNDLIICDYFNKGLFIIHFIKKVVKF